MTYLEDLWLKTLKKELVKQEKIVEQAKEKLLYDPLKSFLDCLEKFNEIKDLSIKRSLALEAEIWREKALKFDLVKYLDKWQNKQIIAESHIQEIQNKLYYLKRRDK